MPRKGSAPSRPPLTKSKDNYHLHNSSLLIAACVSLGVICIFLLSRSYPANNLGPPIWKTIHTTSIHSRTEWDDTSRQFSLDLTKHEVPLVITNGPATLWGDLADQWDFHNLIPQSTADSFVLQQCRVHSSPLFVLERERDVGGMIGAEQSSPVLYEDISLNYFMNTLFSKEKFLYWTGLMSSFTSTDRTPLPTKSAPSLQHLAYTSWAAFHVMEPALLQGLQDQGDDFWEPMLWLSQPGVVAQTHFDSQHNFFTTIFGIRRFTFFPPSFEMNPFPSIHRSNRQSQLHLEEEAHALLFKDNIKMSNISEMEQQQMTYQIDLMPGETLYIPPYWYHRVETLSPSLGVSVNSPSAVEAILQQALWTAVPLGAFHTVPQKKSVVVLYLQLLVENVCTMALQEFARVLYKSRYSLLFPPLWIETHHPGYSCEWEQMHPAVIEKFSSTVHSIASIVEEAHASMAIRKVFLSDYIEQMSRWAVGEVRDTAPYIYHCLAAW